MNTLYCERRSKHTYTCFILLYKIYIVSSIYLEKFRTFFLPNISQKLLLFSRTQITLHDHFYCVQTFQESLFASQPNIYNPDNLFATLIVSHKYCHSKGFVNTLYTFICLSLQHIKWHLRKKNTDHTQCIIVDFAMFKTPRTLTVDSLFYANT